MIKGLSNMARRPALIRAVGACCAAWALVGAGVPVERAEADGPREGRRIVVVFRYDDYSSRSSTEVEKRLIQAFKQRHASITFGVIPRECALGGLVLRKQGTLHIGPEKREILRDAVRSGVVDVAMHGCSHQTIRLPQRSEFAGLSYRDQRRVLALGKRTLEELAGVPVTTFIPPWNSYDLTTLRALEDVGFKCLSASLGGDATAASKLAFVPADQTTLALREMVDAARASGDAHPVITIVLHDFDFAEANRWGPFTLDDMERTLDWLTSESDIRIMSVGQVARSSADIGVSRFLSNRAYISPGLAPPFVRVSRSPVYLSTEAADDIIRRVAGRSVAFYLVLLLASFVIAYAVMALVARIGVVGVFVGAAVLLLAASAGRSVLADAVGCRAATLAVAAVGVCASGWLFRLRSVGGSQAPQ